jgi:hypothetical protein
MAKEDGKKGGLMWLLFFVLTKSSAALAAHKEDALHPMLGIDTPQGSWPHWRTMPAQTTHPFIGHSLHDPHFVTTGHADATRGSHTLFSAGALHTTVDGGVWHTTQELIDTIQTAHAHGWRISRLHPSRGASRGLAQAPTPASADKSTGAAPERKAEGTRLEQQDLSTLCGNYTMGMVGAFHCTLEPQFLDVEGIRVRYMLLLHCLQHLSTQARSLVLGHHVWAGKLAYVKCAEEGHAFLGCFDFHRAITTTSPSPASSRNTDKHGNDLHGTL